MAKSKRFTAASKPRDTPNKFCRSWAKRQPLTESRPLTEPRPKGAVLGRMTTWLRVAAAFLATFAAAFAQDTLDPAFARIPFDSWLTGHDQARFQWSARTG